MDMMRPRASREEVAVHAMDAGRVNRVRVAARRLPEELHRQPAPSPEDLVHHRHHVMPEPEGAVVVGLDCDARARVLAAVEVARAPTLESRPPKDLLMERLLSMRHGARRRPRCILLGDRRHEWGH